MGSPLSAAELMRDARFDEDARNFTKGVLCRAEDYDELRTLSAREFARVENAHPRNSKASCQSPPLAETRCCIAAAYSAPGRIKG
jgi:hypothetical protein